MSKICPKCGESLNDEATICEKCNYSFEEVVEKPAIEEKQTVEKKPKNTKNKKSLKIVLVIIGMIALQAALIGIMIGIVEIIPKKVTIYVFGDKGLQLVEEKRILTNKGIYDEIEYKKGYETKIVTATLDENGVPQYMLYDSEGNFLFLENNNDRIKENTVAVAIYFEKYEVNYNTCTTTKLDPDYYAFLPSESELPSITRKGYVFEGWYLDNLYRNKCEEGDLVLGNITLYAKWSVA